MTTRRQVRVLTLSMVLGAHLIIVWLLITAGTSFKVKSDSLQLVWIPPPPPPEPTSDTGALAKANKNAMTRRRVERNGHQDHPSAPASITTEPFAKDHATAAPDWTEELPLAAKHALAKDLAQRRHDHDFAHDYPTAPTPLPQFAWDHAATHRVEAIPGGGIAININDNCVLLIFPFPFVSCGIGKRTANGDLFEHLPDK